MRLGEPFDEGASTYPQHSQVVQPLVDRCAVQLLNSLRHVGRERFDRPLSWNPAAAATFCKASSDGDLLPLSYADNVCCEICARAARMR